MAYKQGTISHGSTGVKTITVGFQPLGAELIVGGDPGSVASVMRLSMGQTDGTNQVCDSYFADGSRGMSDRANDCLVSLQRWDSGTSTYVEDTRAEFDSFTATEFKYNVTIANANRQYRYRIWG